MKFRLSKTKELRKGEICIDYRGRKIKFLNKVAQLYTGEIFYEFENLETRCLGYWLINEFKRL